MVSSTPESSGPRIKFENPPIHELSVGLFHLPIQELRAQHVGIYWDRIRQQFPLCQQKPPIGIGEATAFQDLPDELFPLPRFWFSSNDHPLLIQVQRNAFLLNWRRPAQGDYPHYETVLAEFWKEFERYKSFIQDSADGKIDVIQRCELHYINLIEPNEFFADASQFKNIVPPIASMYAVESDKRRLSGMQAVVTYRISPTLVIDLITKLGYRQGTEPKELISALELKAYGAPDDLSLDKARAWYDSAHDAVYELFLDATDGNVQKTLWRPQ